MALKTKSIQGTRDIVPAESVKWQYVERVTLETARAYGFAELRLPTIEKTELFQKSVGETTDVVQKEMYTFEKGRESITLRPEGTAGTVRAVMETGLLGEALPVKVCYILSCFRHERPQAGRLREFHQFGVECFGSPSPSADAEVIGVAKDIFNRLGLGGIELRVNSIGCPSCRPGYNEALVEYYRRHEQSLCPLCKERLEKNPLRLLDCKNESCAALASQAPVITDYLCDECGAHFEGLQKRLRAMDIHFTVDPFIVRGLDYYTKTVFEFVTRQIGSQGTVCGGGRYDLLTGQMGGPPTPALGFAMGLERLLMLMEAQGCAFPALPACDCYIGSIGEEQSVTALKLASTLRAEGFQVLVDTVGRSVKAQMKYANKIGAKFSMIIGEDELAKGQGLLKNMSTGEETQIPLDDSLQEHLYNSQIMAAMQELSDAVEGGADPLPPIFHG